MKKLSTCFAALLLLAASIPAYGQLLWRVSGNGLQHPAHILGSHHAFPGDFAEQVPGFRKAFDLATIVVGEVHHSDMNAMQDQSLMIEYMTMPEGYSYRELLSPEEYTELDDILKATFGTGLEEFAVVRPSFLTYLISMMTVGQLFPEIFSPEFVPLDIHIMRSAEESGKRVAGLETVTEQLDVLYNTDNVATQVKDLLCAARNMDHAAKILTEITEAYRAQELKKLMDISKEGDEICPSEGEQNDRLFRDRNNSWMEQLPALMSGDAALIVVGAAHLPGEQGIINLLMQAGYELEPVR